jgi:hypothetical protein
MAENNTRLYRPKGGRGQARLTPSSTLILAVGIAGSIPSEERNSHREPYPSCKDKKGGRSWGSAGAGQPARYADSTLRS